MLNEQIDRANQELADLQQELIERLDKKPNHDSDWITADIAEIRALTEQIEAATDKLCAAHDLKSAYLKRRILD